MHRISALLQKRLKDGKNSDVEEDLYSYAHEDSSDGSGSFRSPPRLVRSPGIRGWRNAEDNADLSRFSLSSAADHSSESASILASSANAAFNLSSRYPSNVPMGSPLPSPPRSPILGATQAPSLWPLPSPRQQPKRHEENERHLNVFPLGHSDNRNGQMLDGDTHKSLQSTMSMENLQRYSSPSGLTVLSSSRAGGKGRGSSGIDLSSRHTQFVGSAEGPSHVHMKQVEPSSHNGRIVRPMKSLQDSKVQKDPRHWKPEQNFHGDTADEVSGVEYSHTPKYSHQNGAVSRDGGYSPRHPQALGSPTLSSPPLSPSASRTLSPGGWIKGHLLGSGAFGKVYKGIHSGTGEFCAIKEVEFVQNDHRSKEAAEQLKKEVTSLSTLQHPNIVQYKGSELVGNTLYIYLELISGGSLYKLYQEFKKLEEPVIRRYTRQILLGLHHLHSRKFMHRDIKCANILVDQDGTIKLADFGVAKYIKEQGVPFSLKGSPHWMAPEVIMSVNTGYEYAVDIWGLGCTVIEMVTGKPPWCDLEAAAAMFKITKIGAPPIPECLSADGKSFLRLCLQRNPADRPTAAALLEHPFVQILGEAHHNSVHAFDALNSLQEYEESRTRSSSSSQVSMHPSSSAPSSPRSSYRTLYELNSIHPDLVSHQRDITRHVPMANVEQRKFVVSSSASPHSQRYGNPKGRIPPVAQRRSHEFTHTQARSAPVSPKSSHAYGGLSPSHSADILAGYPTPFSDSRGT